MASISSDADKPKVTWVVLEEGTPRNAKTVGKQFEPGAGTAEVLLSQEELEMVVRGLMSMEMFSSPQVVNTDHSPESMLRWANLRRLIDDLAVVDWDNKYAV